MKALWNLKAAKLNQVNIGNEDIIFDNKSERSEEKLIQMFSIRFNVPPNAKLYLNKSSRRLNGISNLFLHMRMMSTVSVRQVIYQNTKKREIINI